MRSPARYVVLSAVLLGVSPARAGDIDVARKVFAEGVRLYQRGDYEGARRLFKRADAEHHAPPIVYNLALAEERLGHPQAAVDAYEAYVAEAGERGELSAAAAVALAQLKARSTKLRVTTKPPGARVFVDGAPLSEPAPTAFLVTAGHHVVVAQGDGWRDERDVEVRGAGDSISLVLAAPDKPVVDVPAQVADVPRRAADAAPAPAPYDVPSTHRESAPDGLVWGASFAIAPYYLTAVKTPAAANAGTASSVVAGPVLEAGLALTRDFAFLARGFAAIGPDGKPTYAYMGGPGLAVRVGSSLWLGASFIGGQLETLGHDVRTTDNVTARYGTDLVFGGLFEVSFAVVDKPSGQWVVALQPAFLLTERRNDNTALLLPVSFGYRAY